MRNQENQQIYYDYYGIVNIFFASNSEAEEKIYNNPATLENFVSNYRKKNNYKESSLRPLRFSIEQRPFKPFVVQKPLKLPIKQKTSKLSIEKSAIAYPPAAAYPLIEERSSKQLLKLKLPVVAQPPVITQLPVTIQPSVTAQVSIEKRSSRPNNESLVQSFEKKEKEKSLKPNKLPNILPADNVNRTILNQKKNFFENTSKSKEKIDIINNEKKQTLKPLQLDLSSSLKNQPKVLKKSSESINQTNYERNDEILERVKKEKEKPLIAQKLQINEEEDFQTSKRFKRKDRQKKLVEVKELSQKEKDILVEERQYHYQKEEEKKKVIKARAFFYQNQEKKKKLNEIQESLFQEQEPAEETKLIRYEETEFPETYIPYFKEYCYMNPLYKTFDYKMKQNKERFSRFQIAVKKKESRDQRRQLLFKGIVIERLRDCQFRVLSFYNRLPLENKAEFITQNELRYFNFINQSEEPIIVKLKGKLRKFEIDVDVHDIIEYETDRDYTLRGMVVYRYNYQKILYNKSHTAFIIL
jgi:hypothetical protein